MLAHKKSVTQSRFTHCHPSTLGLLGNFFQVFIVLKRNHDQLEADATANEAQHQHSDALTCMATEQHQDAAYNNQRAGNPVKKH